MDKRLFLTIAICLGMFVVFQALFPQQRRSSAPVAGPAADAPAATTAPSAGAATTPTAGPSGAAAPRPKEDVVAIATSKLRLGFSTYGAGIKEAVLLGEKFRRKGTGDQVALVAPPPGASTALATSLSGGAQLGDAEAWAVESRKASGVVFTRAVGRLTLTKTYDVRPDAYTLDISLQLKNDGPEAVRADLTTSYPELLSASAARGGAYFSQPKDQPRAICRAGEAVERLGLDPKKPSETPPGVASFIGIDERYFLGSVLPVPADGRCELSDSPVAGGVALGARLVQPVMVPPGGSVTKVFIGYFGPKNTELLSAGDLAGARLDESIEFGFWGIIARFLLFVLKLFHGVVANWGVCIILLTVAVKAATLPLTQKSMRSMEKMKQLQPQIDALKKKHATDQQAFAAAQMNLFKEQGVNPLGCATMFLQMPIWIALYTTLQTSVELYQAPFVRGWISDLTAPDLMFAQWPWLHILPILMGGTTYLTQLLTPQTGANAQQMKMMTYFMPILFTGMMWSLPSGLTLYIFTNNILSILQQVYIRRTQVQLARP